MQITQDLNKIKKIPHTQITQDLNKIKKNPTHHFLDNGKMVSRKSVGSFSKKYWTVG